MLAYRSLVKYALEAGHTVSVFDGEEWSLNRSTSLNAICDNIKAVEEAQIRIRDKDGNKVAWALVIPYGVGDDETVADHTDNQFMSDWWKVYGRD